jgi:CubicO group peptidase (beta-lactamase class C family)
MTLTTRISVSRPAVTGIRVAVVGMAGLFLCSVLLARPAFAEPTIDAARMDAHVRATMEDWAVPGIAVAIVRDGEIAHLAAFGEAGPAGRAMTVDTPMVIGSVGKSMTALAIAQLVEAGRVDLAASVTRYLPWFSLAGPPEATAKISIGDLLRHTSGLSTAVGQDQRWYVPGLEPEDVARSMTAIRLDRSTGTYEYSNLNYVLLGVVIEAVSGQAYGDYLADHIFEPLGMDHSATHPQALASLGGTAEGHRYLFGMAVPAVEPFPTGMVPAGYQISTAADMGRFVAALTNGGVHAGVDVLTPGGTPTGDRMLLTDWQPTRSSDAMLTSNQSGSTLVTNGDILAMPGQRLGVVVLMNANPIQFMTLPAGASDLAADLASFALGRRPPASPPSVRTVYLWLDAIIIVLFGLLVIHVLRARTWPVRRLTSRHPRVFLARLLGADLLLPLVVLVGLPLAIGAMGSSPPGDVIGGWAFLLWTLPDLAVALLILSAVPLMVGAAKLASLTRSTSTIHST